jgi:hypothetical protein
VPCAHENAFGMIRRASILFLSRLRLGISPRTKRPLPAIILQHLAENVAALFSCSKDTRLGRPVIRTTVALMFFLRPIDASKPRDVGIVCKMLRV